MISKKSLSDFLKRIFKNRFRAAILIALISVIGLLSWRTLVKKDQQPEYQTATVEKGTIVASVSASGQVLMANITEVTSKASGLVEEVYVSDNDWVEGGQKILKIALDQEGKQNQAQAYSSYLSAKNSLESAQATQYSLQAAMFEKWDTFKELAESDDYENSDGTPRYDQRSLSEFHIPEKEWLAAEVKYKNQQAVISQAQAAVNNAWLSYQATLSEVTAPVSGTITALSFVEGMRVGAQETTAGTRTSQKIAVIESEGTPIASCYLSEIDASRVETGQKATITLDSIPDKTFTGKVVSVDRIGAVTSGVTNYPVVIRFDTSSEQILPNMSAAAEIITEARENVLLVPPQAVRTQAGQTIVRVLLNGKPQEKQVEVGLETSDQAEIISGLSEGETVVVSEVTAGGETTFGGGGSMRVIMPGGFGGPR